MDIEIKTTSIPLEVGVEKAGPQGLSAYQVAQKDGFVGTEQEWLASLKGEKGDIGETGPIGPAGPQGERGLTGETGPKGDKGDVGETGATGQPGRDGTNGTNGRDGYVQYTAGDNITIENNVISATGGDLSNYYTKSEIDDKYPIYVLNVPSNFSTSPFEIIYDANTLQKASDIINECYLKGYETCPLIIKYYKSSYASSGILYTMPVARSLNTQSTSYDFIANSSANGTSANRNAMYIGRGIQIIGTWSNDVFTCSRITCYGGTYFNITNYLAKNNTSSYTPSANYHPATKKYVDDSIASAITDALGGNY